MECNYLYLPLTPASDHKSQGPFQERFFACNSNSMEASPCCNSVVGHQIATMFCTCHDSTAVVPCTKFCSDHCIRIEMKVKRNFHRIWIAMERPLVKRGPKNVGATEGYWLHGIFPRTHLKEWWRHQMETFSALLAICAGNSPVNGEFPAQRPVTRSFDVFFDLCLKKRLSKQ